MPIPRPLRDPPPFSISLIKPPLFSRYFTHTMTDSTKSSDRPQYCRDATWYPLRTGWQPTYISNQHFGLPPFLTPGDLNSMDSVFRKLAALSWPGYRWCPQPGSPTHSKLQRGLLGRAAEARRDQYRWRVSLDVNHFFPTELSVRTTDGFLEISGETLYMNMTSS